MIRDKHLITGIKNCIVLPFIDNTFEKKMIYMMLVPRRNSFNLFDDFFDDSFFTRKDNLFTKDSMRTDIRETNDKYIVDVDLPGFDKENINLSLDNGYLNISAKVDKEEKNEEAKYVRQERFYGECSRSFYVGDEIKEEDIKAEFKNGILNIEIPKKEIETKAKEIKQIEIK